MTRQHATRIVIKHGSLVSASNRFSLDISTLQNLYRDRTVAPVRVVEAVLEAIGSGPDGIWIDRRDAADLRAEARALEEKYAGAERPPLYGVPFAIQDSIHLARVPT